ncbi:hypothetical protein [Paenibacillus sp. FSL H7-0331]|uniref:hypothetical protein n=1 Tax=Paenibacillus sp. FSL H7-0331 TaxID=1920421 RepID=UPI002117232C|nr:hypothetical protein [Paenibacillus sp. FSL H7-0331]
MTHHLDWEGKTSLMTLSQFPTPEEIVSTGARGVLEHWVKRGVGIKRAEKLLLQPNLPKDYELRE